MKRLATILTLASSLLAATPALAGGWYLMQPPTRAEECGWTCVAFPNSKPTALEQATEDLPEPRSPLSDWHQAEEFEHLAQCQQELARRCEVSEHNLDLFRSGASAVENTRANGFDLLNCSAKCVASDDPRLAR